MTAEECAANVKVEQLDSACDLLGLLIPFALNCGADPDKVIPVVEAARRLIKDVRPEKKKRKRKS